MSLLAFVQVHLPKYCKTTQLTQNIVGIRDLKKKETLKVFCFVFSNFIVYSIFTIKNAHEFYMMHLCFRFSNLPS